MNQVNSNNIVLISTLTIAKHSGVDHQRIKVKCIRLGIGIETIYKVPKSGITIDVLLINRAEYKEHLHTYVTKLIKRNSTTLSRMNPSTRTKIDKLMVSFGVPTVFAPN